MEYSCHDPDGAMRTGKWTGTTKNPLDDKVREPFGEWKMLQADVAKMVGEDAFWEPAAQRDHGLAGDWSTSDILPWPEVWQRDA